MLKPIYIEATNIPDAWFQCINSILNNGFKYKIQYGSFIGQTRLEFDWITVYIKYPYNEPYNLMLPQIPPHLNIPNPVENGYIEQYLPYLMTGEKNENEDYTYGQRLVNYNMEDYSFTNMTCPICHEGIYIRRKDKKYLCDCLDTRYEWQKARKNNFNESNQVKYWIKKLKETPNTNQAILQVAKPSDCELNDPPCLRHIDMRIKEDKLIFYPYFRSWDLWGGFPANLAGIAVLQKYIADEIGIKCGEIITSSKGLHIYGYVEELAKIRTGKN